MNLSYRLQKKIKSEILIQSTWKRLEKLIQRKRGAVILMYHSVPKNSSGYAFETPVEIFKQQMAVLERNFNVISLPDLADMLQRGKTLQGDDKPKAAITFDDGYEDNFSLAYPILKDVAFPFAVFLTTNFIETDYETFMSWEQARELGADKSVTIGSHGITHANMRMLKTEDKKKEIQGSKRIIEQNIVKKVSYFAYPSGGYDSKALRMVEKNYSGGFKDRTSGDSDDDPRKLARISIDSKHNELKKFMADLVGSPFLRS